MLYFSVGLRAGLVRGICVCYIMCCVLCAACCVLCAFSVQYIHVRAYVYVYQVLCTTVYGPMYLYIVHVVIPPSSDAETDLV